MFKASLECGVKDVVALSTDKACAQLICMELLN